MRRAPLLALLCSTTVFAQDPGPSPTVYEVSLADADVSQRVEPGARVRIKIINKLPGRRYSWEIEETGLLAPLPTGAFTSEGGDATPRKLTPACTQLLDAVSAATDEAVFRSRLGEAKAKADDAACTSSIAVLEALSVGATSATYTIDEGRTLTVRVRRLNDENRVDREWRYQLSAAEDRQWLIHYGFALLPDKNDTYFAANAPGGGFAITPSTDTDDYAFEPTVAFSFVPRRSIDKPLIPKFTAGLGVDINERLFFGGASWIIGDNVSIFAGIAAHEQTRLKGIYQVGQTLQENLQPDQLVDKKFDLNAIFGIGFRFDRNPFSGRDPAPSAPGGNQNDGDGDDDTDDPVGPADDGAAEDPEVEAPADANPSNGDNG